jgi:hypothetical protein
VVLKYPSQSTVSVIKLLYVCHVNFVLSKFIIYSFSSNIITRIRGELH